jgi:serine phosphatase RsbU (regulator of sigma subunit)
MKFKISLSVLFIVGLAVIFIISMCSLAGIAVNSVRGLGKHAALTTADSVYRGTSQLYLEHTNAMSEKYSSLFIKATLFAKLIADQASASFKLYKFYNDSKNDYIRALKTHQNPNGVITNSGNPKFWYWGTSDKLSLNTVKKLNYLYNLVPMMKYISNYYPEYLGTFIVDFEGNYLFEYFEDSFGKYAITLPDKNVLKKYYLYPLVLKNNWSKIYRDITGKFVMTTYFPIHGDNGKVIGRAGIDIDIEELIKLLSTFDVTSENDASLRIKPKNVLKETQGKIFSFIIDPHDSTLISFPVKYCKMFGLPANINKGDVRYYHQTISTKMDESSISEVKKLYSKFIKEKEGYTEISLNNANYIITFTRIPVTNWIFGVVVDTNDVVNSISEIKKEVNIAVQKLTLNFILISGTFILVAILVITLFFRNILLVPIKKLKTTVNKMRNGDYDISLKESGAKEIADLILSFNYLGKELTNYTKELKKEIGERERTEGEISVAKQIQNSILPQVNKLFNRTEFELYAELVPSEILAGDFYDYFMLSKDKVAFLVADVSGKGISAAFYMTVAKSVLRDTCLQYHDDPADVMLKVNKILCEEYGIDMFISVFLVYYDLKTNTIKYSNSGHPNIMRFGDAGIIDEIGLKKEPVLGFMKESTYYTFTKEVKVDEILILFTNGLVDASDKNGVFYGRNRFIEFIKKQDRKSAEDLTADVLADIKRFAGGKKIADRTILTFIRKQ